MKSHEKMVEKTEFLKILKSEYKNVHVKRNMSFFPFFEIPYYRSIIIKNKKKTLSQ